MSGYESGCQSKREVNPICTPLGPHNKLVFAPGLLGATNSPNGNRISVGCKSPLTEGIKESNSGGQPGGHLAKLGIMAIIVEDMATEGEWWQLELSKDSAKLVPSTVAGLNNFDAVAKLVETYGDNVRLELTDPSRAVLIKEDDEKSQLLGLVMPMVVTN